MCQSKCCPGDEVHAGLFVLALLAAAALVVAVVRFITADPLAAVAYGVLAVLAVSVLRFPRATFWHVVGFGRMLIAPLAVKRNYHRAVWAAVRWRWLCRNLGLSKMDQHAKDKAAASGVPPRKPPVRHPRARVVADHYGVVARVKTVPGTGRREFEDSAEHVADYWRCQRVQVSQPKPGRLIVRGLIRDPLAEMFGPEGAPAGTYDRPDPARPYLGLSEWAEQRYLSLAGQTGIVVGGLPGRGKTSLIGSLLCQWSPTPAVQLALLDGKGSADYEDWQDRAWRHSDDQLEAAVDLLEDCAALMRARLGCVVQVTGRKNSWHVGPTEAWPLIVVLIDECQQFLDVASYKGDKDMEAMARRCVALAAELIRKGRSAMFVTILATQKPTTDSIPSTCSANAGISLCFGVKTVEAAASVLGPDIREYGSVSPVGLRDDSMVGVLTSTLATGSDPFTRIRVPGFTEADIAMRAYASAHNRRDPWSLLPGAGETVPDTVAELVSQT